MKINLEDIRILKQFGMRDKYIAAYYNMSAQELRKAIKNAEREENTQINQN